ncbi:hypothetical protein J2W46_000951 [Paraburkholderia strydomiana]|jgi:hypothetical protein|nr:hypothetical protein [Paraburkholderia strydomiana]
MLSAATARCLRERRLATHYANDAGSALPPQITTAIFSPGERTQAPEVSAAKAVAPPGSAAILNCCHSAICDTRWMRKN